MLAEDKAKIISELTQLVRDNTGREMGIRDETIDLSRKQRSKAIRAYLVDLFGDDAEGINELDEAINESIN